MNNGFYTYKKLLWQYDKICYVTIVPPRNIMVVLPRNITIDSSALEYDSSAAEYDSSAEEYDSNNSSSAEYNGSSAEEYNDR